MQTKLLILLAALCSVVLAQVNPRDRADWNRPVQPFRIIGNLYYVGVAGVSSFLITTPKGDLLLDGGFPETAPLIEKNIAALGFHVNDVKFLLNSHAHYDHCGGLTELKKVSGAQMVASDGDTSKAGRVRRLDCSDRQHSFEPVAVDRVVVDGETVRLGDTVLTAHVTPGHTAGCTTWSTETTEQGRTYRVVFYCSTTVAGNRLVGNRARRGIVAEYEASFAKLKAIRCDVFLAPHGGFFRLDEKRAALAAGRRDAFVDPAEMARHVAESERAFREELQRQKAAR
ncbi:MAG: subclass B3 metallo-beta-lactamase [Bryobacteraceae bacterium]